MLAKGLKNRMGWAVLVVTTVCVLGTMGTAQASRRAMGLNDMMEKAMTRQVQINGKQYSVYIDHTSKSMVVMGYVEDWDEMDRVEKYFRLRGPADYQVNCELDFGY